MGYYGRGRNPRGDYTLYNSFTGKRLLKKLTELDTRDISKTQDAVGTRVVYLGEKRSLQWVFEITEVEENRGNAFPVYYTMNKLTPTGKISSAKNARASMSRGNLIARGYKYYEGVTKDVQNYLEETKAHTVSGKARDSQRSRVYDAENKAKKKYGDIKKFDNVWQANNFLEDILASKEFNEMFPDFKYHGVLEVTICNRMTYKARAKYRKREIAIAGNSKKWGLSTWVILHELAHFTSRGAQHNPPFTTHFANLIEMVDEEKADKLRLQFDIHNVEY